MSFAFGLNSPTQPSFAEAKKIAISFVCSSSGGSITLPEPIFTVSLNGKPFRFDDTQAVGVFDIGAVIETFQALFSSNRSDCWFTLTTTDPAIMASVTNGVNILEVSVSSGAIGFSGITAVIEF